MKVYKIYGYRWIVEYRDNKVIAYLGGKFMFDYPSTGITILEFISHIPSIFKNDQL